YGDDRWVWANHRRYERAEPNANLDRRGDKYRSELYEEVAREREPTTRRPIPGGAQNDEIEDYPENENPNVGTRNYNPYNPNNFNAGQVTGFNNYPNGGFAGPGASGVGSAANGILVGPGGPTGIIGRPQNQYFPPANGQYPGGFPGQTGINFPQVGGFPGYPGQFPQLGFANAQGGGLPGNNGIGQFAGGYPNQNGLGFPQAQSGTNFYPGGFGGQNGLPINGGQFPSAQYPGAQYPGGQYPGVQYPGVQYPGEQQYPGVTVPQYTEGYGLGYNNPINPFIGPYNSQVGNSIFATGYDETESKRKLEIEDKSASVESRSAAVKKVDDKVHKNFKKYR
ncbi:spidroin-2-like, partial [Teleopsis dalmanni]|uniref:spidroin-2-like n=1 Tax=Teleopsis dalmanni TaxID=139649 RepID=UPI0018CE634C